MQKLLPSKQLLKNKAVLQTTKKISITTAKRRQSNVSFRTKPLQLASNLFAPTVMKKQHSAEEIVVSQKLLTQAGYISQLSSGIYHYLPLATRVIEKICAIIDEELQKIGCQKLVMPILLESELWKTSGRLAAAGEELITINKPNKEFVLAPTHEEAVTALVAAASQIKPQEKARLYQIGTKFRYEQRPRFGLMRCREFVMKDLYSFDRTQEDAFNTYNEVREAYINIFNRLGLKYVVVEADSGMIGGSKSEEFQALTGIGEDTVITCACGKYNANLEKATGANDYEMQHLHMLNKSVQVGAEALQQARAGANAVKIYRCVLKGGNLSEQLKLSVLMSSAKELNPIKISAMYGGATVSPQEVKSIVADSKVMIDTSCHEIWEKLENEQAQTSNGVTVQLVNVRKATTEDKCVNNHKNPSCCNSNLQAVSGIEIGHIFYLASKYSAPFKANFLSIDKETNKSKHLPFEMGCYGIGVSRLIQTVVEGSNDKNGIIWPFSIAPYRVCITPLHFGKGSMTQEAHSEVMQKHLLKSKEIGQKLQEKYPVFFNGEILVDDRLFTHIPQALKEGSLQGYPYLIYLGQNYLQNGVIELQVRKTNQKHMLTEEQLYKFFDDAIANGELVL